jgi:GntR family transcriptional regulator
MTNWKANFQIDRQEKVPLYHQIGENIRALIGDQTLQSGDAVPSEWDLSELYGVSRLTVRRALDELVHEGLLRRRHGVGTFVADRDVTRITPSKLGFTHKMRQMGLAPSSHVVSINVIPAPPIVATHLGIGEGAPVVELVRVRLADEEAIMLETAYLSQARFPDLSADSFTSSSSLYEFLHTRYQVAIAAVEQTLEPTRLRAVEAVLLKSEPESPAILNEVVAFAADNSVIEYSRSVTRGNKCKFYFRFREEDAATA